MKNGLHKAGSHRRQPAVFSFLHGLCPPFRVPPASGQYGPKRYSGDLCVEFKSCLNDFETSFEEIMTGVMP